MSAAEEILEMLRAGRSVSARHIATLQTERPELFDKATGEEPESERQGEQIEREAFARLLAASNPEGDSERVIELTEEMRQLIAKSLRRSLRRGKRAVELLEEERGFSQAILPLDFVAAPEDLAYYAIEYNTGRAALSNELAWQWSEQLALDEIGEIENKIVASKRLSGEALRLIGALGGLWHANAAASGCEAYLRNIKDSSGEKVGSEVAQHRTGCLHERSIIQTSYRALARALYGGDSKNQRDAVKRDLAEIESTPLAYSIALIDSDGKPGRIEETGYLIEAKRSAVSPGKGLLELPLGKVYARLLYAGRIQLLPAWLLNRYNGARLQLLLAVALKPGMRYPKAKRDYLIGAKRKPLTLGRVADWLPTGFDEPKRFSKWLVAFAADLEAARDPHTGERSTILLDGVEYRRKEGAWLLSWRRTEGQTYRQGGANLSAGRGKLIGTGGQTARVIVRKSPSEKAEKGTEKATKSHEAKSQRRAKRFTSIGEILLRGTPTYEVEPARELPPVEGEPPLELPTIPQLLARWRNLREVERKAWLRATPGLAEALALDEALLPTEEPGK